MTRFDFDEYGDYDLESPRLTDRLAFEESFEAAEIERWEEEGGFAR